MHKSIKSTRIAGEQESIEILFLQHRGCAMWCIVRYINLPPTLCRSKQTLRLLFAVLPQQYFYLSCETAIQIDEVQQHDIFCTSITLRGWATWVKSQQTITFPDISSPHSDRWWILPDKAFIIAENRECTKISSLFFSPPSSASLSKSRWTQLQKQNGLRTHRQKGEAVNRCRIFTSNQKVYPYCRTAITALWARGHRKWKQLFCASSDFDPATMRGATMEMSYDGMPLKISPLLSFISEFNTLRLSSPRCIESPCVAGKEPTPTPKM